MFHVCPEHLQCVRACLRAARKPHTRAHTFPAEDQSAERSRPRSIQAAERLSADARPAPKQPITFSLAGGRQPSSHSAVRMLLRRSGRGASHWHDFVVTGGALSSVLIAFGTKFCVRGSDFFGPRSEGIVTVSCRLVFQQLSLKHSR